MLYYVLKARHSGKIGDRGLVVRHKIAHENAIIPRTTLSI
jgi:hypothetical protein